MKITIVVDNNAGNGLAAEHGLSFLIETPEKRIIFDTGQGPSIETNAPKLRIDMTAVNTVVFSHGHYDHTGGAAYVLGAAPNAEVYCHPQVFIPRYSVTDGEATSVGLPAQSARALNGLPENRLHWVLADRKIADGVFMTGPIERDTDFEDVGGPFFLGPDGRVPDPLEDDAALWLETGEGIIIVTGCCHAGIVNTINHVLRRSGGAPLRAVIGGLHLVNADERRLAETAASMRSFSPELVVPCHCTGERGVATLKEALGEAVLPGRSGLVFEF